MRRRLLIALATLLLAVGALTTAGAPAQPAQPTAKAQDLTFYLVAGITTDAFYLTMRKGAQAEAKKLGVRLVWTGAPRWGAPDQIPHLNAAIARKPDAILIAPTDKTALISPIRRAVQAGIPVATVDTFITAPLAFTNVSTDNVGGGRAAADALAKSIGSDGQVAILNVQPGISTTDQRQQGFIAQVKKKYPNMQYVGVQFHNDDQTKAAQLTTAMLARYPDLKGIFVTNVVGANGANAALKNAGKSGEVRLVEFDAGPEQVAALKSGTVDALIAQYPYGIGQLGVRLAHRYVAGNKAGIKKHYGTSSAIVTKTNVNSPSIKKFLYTK
jgi:ribose transport system substrate-binding protein